MLGKGTDPDLWISDQEMRCRGSKNRLLDCTIGSGGSCGSIYEAAVQCCKCNKWYTAVAG